MLAYKVLGSNHQYNTKLYTSKRNKQLQNAVITFSGDPTLYSENLANLFEPIKGKNIKGKIFLDVSLFSISPHSPNIMMDDLGTTDT